MKKITLVALLAATSLTTLNSCSNYKSLSDANRICQLSSNPFVKQVAKSVINDLTTTMVQNGITKVGKKIGLNTAVSSLLTNAGAINNFKSLLTSKYGVASNLVETASINTFGTVKDVVSLIAQNGKNIKF